MRKFTFLSRRCVKGAFLVLLFIFAGTGGLSAQVSLTVKDPTLGQVIDAVRSQSGYQFFYDTKLTDTKVNTVDVSGGSVGSLLEAALKDTPITYKIEDSIVYLSMAETVSGQQQGQRIVTGTVTDSKGEALIGVAVTVSETMTGVSTDFEGRYSIRIPDQNSQLVFSYLGYDSVTLTPGTRSVMDVTMSESTIMVDNVVVTAMGIKRQEKSLTYNVQTVKSDEFQTVKDANFMNSLAGKIAGVNITQSSSGIGGSSRVVMRGTKSLFGDNNALYVVDGIPLSDNKSTQSDNYYEVDIQGDSEGISMINPDDIESMTALTGAAAAALYGNRGSNGVIVITTKKGKAGHTRVSISNNTTFNSPFVMPEFQNTYGRSGESYFSWGEKMSTPSSYNPADFFQTGYNTMNTVSVSTGNEMHQMYASIGAVNARGIIPNQKYSRYNFNLKTSSVLVKDKLNLDFSVSYTDQRDQNAVAHGLYFNPLVAIYLFPPGDDINRFLPYKIWNPERGFQTQNWSYSSEGLEGVKQNPFWIVNKNMLNNNRDRFIISGTLDYKILDWMSLLLRARVDKSNAEYVRKLYASTDILFAHSKYGFYSDYSRKDQNLYADFLLNIDKDFCNGLRLTANVGGSFNDTMYDYRGQKGSLSVLADRFVVGNMNVENNDMVRTRMRTNAFYATAQLGYKNMLYFDITGRIDFFSSLKSVHLNADSRVWTTYPSVGLSAIITEMFDMPENVLSYWKVRASYTQVGNPPQPYLLDEYTNIVKGNLDPASYPMLELEPERTKAFEIGTDIRLWMNKINIAFTYYNSNTYNQLFKYSLPPSSGYTHNYANAGQVSNKGIELSVGINQKIGPVDWQGTIVYSHNRNKIIKLLGDKIIDPVSGEWMDAPTQYEVSTNIGGSYRMILTEGGTMSDIYVNSLKRDATGNVYVHPITGAFSVDTDNYIKIGQATPKCNLSMRNNFSWKGLSLGFMIDARVGGVVVSSTQAMMDQYGVSKTSADARDNGGVEINFGKLDAQNYYQTIAAGKSGTALSEYTYSATNVRLRELTLAYTLPSKWFNGKANMTVSLIGRNLFLFYCKAPFDPEITSNTGTYFQGYDYFMTPSLRSLGFGVNISF